MSSPSDSPHAGFPAHVRHPPPSSSLHATHAQITAQPNELDISELAVPCPTPVMSASPSLVNEQRPPLGMAAHPPEWRQSNSLSIGHGGWQVVTAVAIVTIQVQLLSSGSLDNTPTTNALLSFGIILELLSILFAICFIQSQHDHPDGNHPHPQHLSTLAYLAWGAPTVLILMGIVVLGIALVVEMLKTSMGTAFAMSSFLIIGVLFCLLGSLRGVWMVVMTVGVRPRMRQSVGAADGHGHQGHVC